MENLFEQPSSKFPGELHERMPSRAQFSPLQIMLKTRKDRKVFCFSRLLTLRPLHFRASAIPFPQIFQACTTVILLSIMWFLWSFTDWFQASHIMTSMCREKYAFKKTHTWIFLCMMAGGADYSSLSKGSIQNGRSAVRNIKDYRCTSMPKVTVIWRNASKKKREIPPTPITSTFPKRGHVYTYCYLNVAGGGGI